MTTTVKVHVNGNYRATAKVKIEGEDYGEPIVVHHGEEKTLPHLHGKTCVYEITEEVAEGE